MMHNVYEISFLFGKFHFTYISLGHFTLTSPDLRDERVPRFDY
jgi:hypothetical protein